MKTTSILEHARSSTKHHPLAPQIAGTTCLAIVAMLGATETAAAPRTIADDRVLAPASDPPRRTTANADDDDSIGTAHVFLNRRGAKLVPGTSDSRHDRSSLITTPSTLPAFEGTEQDWQEILQCVRDTFAPYNIAIADTDPGDVPHIEAIVGGTDAAIGRSQGRYGVAPFAANCGHIRDAIVFVFSAHVRADPLEDRTVNQQICEVTAHEIGHAFGLDHAMLPADLMSYLPYRAPKRFQYYDTRCGEYSERACGFEYAICAELQNSAHVLALRVGARGARAPQTFGGCSTAPPAWLVTLVLLPLVLGRWRGASERRG